MRRTFGLKAMAAAGITSAVLAAGLMVTSAAGAVSPDEITTSAGVGIYVLSPDNAADEQAAEPVVYLMPRDGYSAQGYLDDGLAEAYAAWMEEGRLPQMYLVLCRFEEGRETEIYAQMDEIAEAVQAAYPVSTEESLRVAAGEGVGGYLALMLELTGDDGAISDTPVRFATGVSIDGDFTSEDNHYAEACGDLCSLLSDHQEGATIGSWTANYHTRLYSNADEDLSYAGGGSDDIASLFRSDNLMNPENIAAWDYSVFRYDSKMAEHIAGFTDRLEQILAELSPYITPAEEEETEETAREDAEPQTETEMITQGADRRIDLSGLWHFATVTAISSAAPEGINPDSADYIFNEADYTSWEEVQPGLDWWTEDFAECLEGNAYYTGYAWYVKEIEIPEDFDLNALVYHGGMIDEADECYINGTRIGETGIPEEGGSYDNSNPWDEERSYDIPDGLLQPGKNVVAVRMCNGSGGGGWYTGPIEIVSRESEEAEEANPRLYETTFYSEALGLDATYRVYLPEGYLEGEDSYPVVYMLHGIGSTGKSFLISGVPQLLDEAIADGEIPPCIVIFPDDMHPQKMSWWSGEYADYVNIDLIAEVESTLRVIADRDHRFIAGESMGGGGAWLNAWNNPDLYGGIFDIYGAVNFAGVLDELISDERTAEDFANFKIYMVAGNHDMYQFDLVHLQLAARLHELGVSCRFEIADGEHNSDFYLPYIKEGFACLLEGL